MKDYFFLALNNFRRRKLRAWLTMIGIFIGIAAVVALISLSQGLQYSIEQQFQNLGKDKIVIQPNSLGSPGSATSQSLILTSRDLNFIQNINGVDWVIGVLIKTDQVKFRDEAKIEYIAGINSRDLDLNLKMQGVGLLQGRSLKEGDNFKVVLGYSHSINDKIWKRGIKVGETMIIEGQEFKVVGILDSVGNPFDDANIYIAKDTLKGILNIKDEESQILAKASEGANVTELAKTIERKLRSFRGEKEGQETFSVTTSDQLLKSFQSIFGIVQAVLVGIAAISLVVGGVGIMNTMYTSVLERTKEIGTMKAVGARNSDILLIFLFESGLLGLIGGAIGIAIGFTLGKGVEYVGRIALGTNLLQAIFPWYLIVGALTFSFLIGSLSGIFPALQAAKLKPADALRYE
jgi:putative ABC transport system permease protein